MKIPGGYIELPLPLKKKRCLLNIQNKDEQCLKWALLAGLFPKSANSNRPASYKEHERELDFGGLMWPVDLHDVHTVEFLNHIQIDVYAYNEDSKKKIYPIYTSNKLKYEKVISLLLLLEGWEKQHYVLIKNINTLLQLNDVTD